MAACNKQKQQQKSKTLKYDKKIGYRILRVVSLDVLFGVQVRQILEGIDSNNSGTCSSVDTVTQVSRL